MNIALLVIGILVGIFVYLQIGRAFGRLDWWVWEVPWNTRGRRILAALRFPVIFYCYKIANDPTKRKDCFSGDPLPVDYLNKGHHNPGNYKAYLILLSCIWPVKLAYSLTFNLVAGTIYLVYYTFPYLLRFLVFGLKDAKPPVIEADSPKVRRRTKRKPSVEASPSRQRIAAADELRLRVAKLTDEKEAVEKQIAEAETKLSQMEAEDAAGYRANPAAKVKTLPN